MDIVGFNYEARTHRLANSTLLPHHFDLATPIFFLICVRWRLAGSYQYFWPFLMRRKCYFRISGQNCDIAIRFSDSDFLKDSNNLTIRRFRVFSVYRSKLCHISVSDLFDRMILNTCHMLPRHYTIIFTKFDVGNLSR